MKTILDCKNSGGYLENYQKALVRTKKSSSFDAHRDRWERASARSNGVRVRQQKIALDAQERALKAKSQYDLPKTVSAKEVVPWPVHTIPEIAIKVPPLDPINTHSSFLSWKGVDFDDSDSVLFAPSIADATSIVSENDNLFSTNDTYSTFDEIEWCDDQRSITRTPSFQSVKEGSNVHVAAVISQAKSGLPIPEDRPETQEFASFANRRQRDSRNRSRSKQSSVVGRGAAAIGTDSESVSSVSHSYKAKPREHSSKAKPLGHSSKTKPPEFLAMKGKLRNMQRSMNESSMSSFPAFTADPYKEPTDKLASYSNPVDSSSSFGDLSHNTGSTDLTSPETFDSGDQVPNTVEDTEYESKRATPLDTLSSRRKRADNLSKTTSTSMVEAPTKGNHPSANYHDSFSMDDPRYAK